MRYIHDNKADKMATSLGAFQITTKGRFIVKFKPLSMKEIKIDEVVGLTFYMYNGIDNPALNQAFILYHSSQNRYKLMPLWALDEMGIDIDFARECFKEHNMDIETVKTLWRLQQ